MTRILTIASATLLASACEQNSSTTEEDVAVASEVDPESSEGEDVATTGSDSSATETAITPSVPSPSAEDGAAFRCQPGSGTALPIEQVTAVSSSTEDSTPAGEPGPPTQLDAPATVAAPGPNAVLTDSGLAYEVLRPGYGDQNPSSQDRVQVHYSGWTTDGKRFDSSVSRGKPSEFPLTSVIAGWTEGLQLMVPGELTRFWIPEALAYQGRPGKPAGMLVFDVQLLSIQSNQAPFPKDGHSLPEGHGAPTDGVAYKIIKEGRADTKVPLGPDDIVQIRHQGWSADEEFIGGTANRGRPVDFVVKDLPSAWCHPLTAMKRGDKARVWASPEASATEQHMVYDLELVNISKQFRSPILEPMPPMRPFTSPAWPNLNDAPTTVDKPRSRARVSAHVTVWDANGKTIQTTQSTGKPQTLALKAMPPSVAQGLQMMDPGDKVRMWIPQELTAESPARREDTSLVFDIEMLEIVVNPPPPPPAPDNASMPPESATTIVDGVRFLSDPVDPAGPNPTTDEMVTFEVIEWSQEGEYLAGTDESGKPVTRPLRSLSPALQAAFTRMSAGQKARIWSSKEQATTRGRPAKHDVVMDVTLTQIGAPARPPRKPMTAPPK